MSSTKVQHPVKMDNPEEKLVQTERNRKEITRRATFNANNSQNKKKHENDRKFGRKRTNSNAAGFTKFFPPHKRRKKEEQLTLPTKFLLGGNIYDPLNLNSLQDEEINRAMNAFTPKSSPLPTPKHRKGAIEVIIPPNLHDPLNLACCDDDAEYEQQLISPFKKSARKARNNRSKKKRNSSSGCSSVEVSLTETSTENKPAEEALENSEVSATTETTAASVTSRNLDLPLKKENSKDKSKFRNKFELKDKIVSPVIPQHRGWTRPHGHKNKHKKAEVMPTFKAKNGMFPYGNYTRYYGYRNPHHALDARLKHFSDYPSLFFDKDVLDIGCNVGHVALSVARDFAARSVVGLDIDRKLIEVARKNVRHYVNCSDSPASAGAGAAIGGRTRTKFFPISMPIVFGPLGEMAESPAARAKFPHNISFVQGNYVLDSDTLLETEQAQFDVILCLSISKWLHLNWGDSGLKQAFRRMFIQLRPGGKLVLEAQSWDSYKKRRLLSETHFRNYQAIKFYPQKFTEYLMSEVGFSKVETIAVPVHPSKGFQRPIQMFTKGIFSSSYSAASTPFYVAPSGRTKAPVYTSVVVSTREADDDDDILAAALADKSSDDLEGDAVFASPEFEADCERFDKRVGEVSEGDNVAGSPYFEGFDGDKQADLAEADCERYDADKVSSAAERVDEDGATASPSSDTDCGYVGDGKDDCPMDTDLGEAVVASPDSQEGYEEENKETEVYVGDSEVFEEEQAAGWQNTDQVSSEGDEVVENGKVLNGEVTPEYDDEG